MQSHGVSLTQSHTIATDKWRVGNADTALHSSTGIIRDRGEVIILPRAKNIHAWCASFSEALETLLKQRYLLNSRDEDPDLVRARWAAITHDWRLRQVRPDKLLSLNQNVEPRADPPRARASPDGETACGWSPIGFRSGLREHFDKNVLKFILGRDELSVVTTPNVDSQKRNLGKV